jgi:hypothetical protein
MLEKIFLYFFILSGLYVFVFVVKFFILLKQDNPPPIINTKLEKILLYLSMAYILTGIVTML